jgi:hypothetical protein
MQWRKCIHCRALIPKNAPSLRVSQGWGLSLVPFLLSILGEQMRTDDADKFARVDDFGSLPEFWEMPLIAGDQVVRSGRVCAFEENVIRGVGRDLKRAGGRDEIRSVFEELKKSPFRMRSSGRDSTARYSAKIGGDRYRRAGFVMARSRTVRCKPSGLSAADTTILVSRTNRRGNIRFLALIAHCR